MTGDCARIVANVKAALKARGVTYAELARRIGLSETSVKRVLSRGTLSLRRLEQICDVIGTSVGEMAQRALGSADQHSEMLTLVQEEALAADPQLFACYHLVANGRSARDIEVEMNAEQEAVRHWLEKLKALRLVTRSSANRAVAAVAVKWRPNGPVRAMYEREVRADFLQSLFRAERETLDFRFAELSDASYRILQRKLDRLAAEFRDLADLDRGLPSVEKRNVGCLLAMRPWVYLRFGKAAGKAAGTAMATPPKTRA